MDLGFVAAETLRGLKRQLRLTAAVTLSVAVTLTLVGASWIASLQVEKLKGYWYEKVEVSVYLCGTSSDISVCPRGELDDSERAAIKTTLEDNEHTKSVFYESKQDAWERFTEQHEGQRLLEQVEVSTMPESFRVKLHDPRKFAEVAADVAKLPGVEKVQDQRKLLAPLFRFIAALQNVSLGLALALVSVATLIISSTVQMAVHYRRHEVAAMRLIGAAPRMIRAPFLGEAATAGLLGGVVAMGALVSFAKFALPSLLSEWGVTVSATTVDEYVTVAPALLFASAAIPATIAGFVLRKHLRN